MCVDTLHDNGIKSRVPTGYIVTSPSIYLVLAKSPSPIGSCQDLGQCQWEAHGKEGACRDQDSHALALESEP